MEMLGSSVARARRAFAKPLEAGTLKCSQPERCLTGPLLNEHEALWILGVLVHGVRDTPGFRSRTLHVFLTKRESFGDTTAVRDHASKHKNH